VQRLGLSATVHPLPEVAAFLAGVGRPCTIIDVSTAKQIDLQVFSPLQREPYPPAGFSGVRLIRELARLIVAQRTTLVFTNTRSGAESATYWLRESLPELASQIECHHASLDREVRLEVEDRLKRGDLRAVVCSTSLELGLDIGCIDLVVMLATPKGVSKALQRTGRAGHSLHEISRGLLMATNLGDLVECCATALLARRGHLDTLRFPAAPLDVQAQHLVGWGCTGEQSRQEILLRVRQAWPYRNLASADFDAVLDFLAGGGRSLRQQYTELFGKIVLTDDTFETRAGTVRRDYLQNVGTIANDGAIRVLLHQTQLGTVEEGFLRQLRPGDVFTLSGRPVRLQRIGVMECWVERADGAVPTVPRWGANKFPLANRVAREIRNFRRELRHHLEARHSATAIQTWIEKRLDCGANNAAIIHRVYAAQHGVSEIPTTEFLLVEELLEEPALPAAETPPASPRRPRPTGPEAPAEPQLAMAAITVPTRRERPKAGRRPPARETPTVPTRHYFFHSLIGRAANDALSRVVGLRFSRRHGGNAIATTDDYGFVLTVGEQQRLQAADLPALFSPQDFSADLAESLKQSALLKYHFRSAAQTGLMVYRNHFGEQKSVRKLQWSAEVIFNVLTEHEPDHVLLREARADAEHSFLDAGRALAYLEDFTEHQRPFRWRTVDRVPPLSFGMYATKIKEALLVEDPRETLERLYHHWWNQLNPATPSS
jgi:ATP-dependent Lhr-like helicase